MQTYSFKQTIKLTGELVNLNNTTLAVVNTTHFDEAMAFAKPLVGAINGKDAPFEEYPVIIRDVTLTDRDGRPLPAYTLIDAAAFSELSAYIKSVLTAADYDMLKTRLNFDIMLIKRES